MSFDRSLLAVESHDLSQADKSIKSVSSFPNLSDGYCRTYFSVSQQLRPELSAKSISQSSQIYLSPEKVRKCLLFNLPIKINQNINFAK